MLGLKANHVSKGAPGLKIYSWIGENPDTVGRILTEVLILTVFILLSIMA